MPIDLALFMEHMRSGRGLVGVFLRGHLWVEKLLVDLIIVGLKRPDALDVERLGYAHKINLALALGVLNDAEAAPMKLMGKIRNRLAHDLEGEPTSEEIKHLEGALSERQKTPFKSLREKNPLDAEGDDRNRLEYVVHAVIFCLGADREVQEWERDNQGPLQAYAILKHLNGTYGIDRTEEEIRELANMPPPRRFTIWTNTSPNGYDEQGRRIYGPVERPSHP